MDLSQRSHIGERTNIGRFAEPLVSHRRPTRSSPSSPPSLSSQWQSLFGPTYLTWFVFMVYFSLPDAVPKTLWAHLR
uniref:Uncharacterized protein n=1 Tax=Steinernema glaseri TaxID=37863 RepID=A0A1I7XY75_9BILA